MRHRIIRPLIIALCGLLAASGSAFAEPNFAGKTVTFLITTRAGGGTDTQARLVGQYLPKYLPGNPGVTYSNLPGAAGVKAVNHFIQRTKPDGTTLLIASGESVEPGTLQNPATKYDPRQLHVIGGTNSGGTVMLIRKDALSRLTDKAAKPVIVGGADPTRTVMTVTLLGAEYLGWNFRWVVGYSGTPGLMLAVQQGEIDVFGTGTLFHLKTLMEKGIFSGLAQDGDYNDGKFVPRAGFPDVPLIPELLKGKMDPVAQEAFETWVFSNQVGKWFALAPGTPADMIESYTAAYRKVMVDPEFMALATKQFGEGFEPQSGKDLQTIISRLATTSPESLDFMTKLRAKHGLATAAK